MNASTKTCSTCKTENTPDSLACRNCGAWLDENPTNVVAIPDAGSPVNAPIQGVESFIDTALIPEDGVGIYIAGAPKPLYLHIHNELIIGRQADATLQAILDLSDLDAFAMGVSRRHAKIQRSASGFEIVDLGSRNGTWLNAERLTPNKPYPFTSGSQVRIGQMRLLVVYQSRLSR